MEEQNNSGAVNPEEQPKPAPRPAPARPGTALWLKIIAGLYALSLIAAFSVINRADAARKTKPKDLDLSKLTGLAKSKKDAVAVIPLYGAISQGSSSRSWDRGSQQIANRVARLQNSAEQAAPAIW